MASIGTAGPVHAAEFFCSSGNVTCLIAAINEANTHAGADTINLDPGTYTLTSSVDFTGLPSITSDITINGEDAATTIIERDPGAPQGFRIFAVAVSGKLTLNGLAVVGGGGAAPGGGIFNEGSLTINDSIIESNSGGFEGGGIDNRTTGTLNLTNSFVIRNGGVFDGGGIFNSGTAIITHSSIIENGATNGGGIRNSGTATIQNSSISGNGADFGGGISNGGTMTITNTTIANNFVVFAFGGGISNPNGTMNITNSTISGNGAFTFMNGGGGGIRNGGILQLQNTIVALNTTTAQPNPAPDCLGPITSLGNNIIGDLSNCDINLLPSDLIDDPGLGAFTDDESPGNGHFPLLGTSRAIDRGNRVVCSKRDQVGNPRNGACDIGAVEFSRRNRSLFSKN